MALIFGMIVSDVGVGVAAGGEESEVNFLSTVHIYVYICVESPWGAEE